MQTELSWGGALAHWLMPDRAANRFRAGHFATFLEIGNPRESRPELGGADLFSILTLARLVLFKDDCGRRWQFVDVRRTYKKPAFCMSTPRLNTCK